MADWALLNTAHKNSGAGSLGSLTIPASTIGNLGILVVSSASGTLTPISGGGTWAQIGKQTDAGNSQDAEWYWVVFTSSVTSITWNTNVALSVVYAEFVPPAGTVAVDVSDASKAFAAMPAAGTVMASNSITPAAAGELLLAATYDQSGDAPNWTPGTGFSMAVQEPGTSGADGACALEWADTASGAQSAGFTANKSGGSYTIQIAAFTPAFAGGGGGGPGAIPPDIIHVRTIV